MLCTILIYQHTCTNWVKSNTFLILIQRSARTAGEYAAVRHERSSGDHRPDNHRNSTAQPHNPGRSERYAKVDLNSASRYWLVELLEYPVSSA